MKKATKKGIHRAVHGRHGTAPRKVCFVITSFIHYSRSLLVLEELRKRPNVDLHIIIGGTALLSKYSSKFAHVKAALLEDGFKNIYELYFNLEGDEAITKAKTVGVGIVEFATLFNHIHPDIVVLRGDRFEILAAAVAAANMNIPIAHIEGGDLSGTLDEHTRHAITKLSQIHFATNDAARNRLLQMGENPENVFNFGSPDVEVVKVIANGNHKADFGKTGSGAKIDFEKGFVMVMFHPVSTEPEETERATGVLLDAVAGLDIPAVWFWPNFDTGAEQISHRLRVFNDEVPAHKIHFMRYLPPKDFIWLLNRAFCLVGNSSAGIKESSFLGIPVVNIGSRQSNRLRGKNVKDVSVEKREIMNAIREQTAVKRYPSSDIYEGKDTAKRIAEVVATAPLDVQKKFHEKNK